MCGPKFCSMKINRVVEEFNKSETQRSRLPMAPTTAEARTAGGPPVT